MKKILTGGGSPIENPASTSENDLFFLMTLCMVGCTIAVLATA